MFTCKIHGELTIDLCTSFKHKNGVTQYTCRECKRLYAKKYYNENSDKVSASNQAWRQRNAEKVKANDARVRKEKPHLTRERQARYKEKNYERLNIMARVRDHGLTLEQYFRMVSDQNDLCKICNKPESKLWQGKVTELCIDHCHETGKVRGLLCFKCNIGIGVFDDNIENIQIAIEYIKSNRNVDPQTT